MAKSRQAYSIIIPARLDSTRLPRKMLAQLGGKPVIQRTYENALKFGAQTVVIATDSPEIYEVALGFGAEVCMTSPVHSNGTARLAETVALLGLSPEEVVLNVQGDEPFLPASVGISVVNDLLKNGNAEVGTAVLPIKSPADVFDVSVVKVLRNKHGTANYFSRAPVPWNREQFAPVVSGEAPSKLSELGLNNYFYYRHVGIYAYRVSLLKTYANLSPSPWEALESLEQLRLLWHGYTIFASVLNIDIPKGIDTPSDLQAAQTYFSTYS